MCYVDYFPILCADDEEDSDFEEDEEEDWDD